MSPTGTMVEKIGSPDSSDPLRTSFGEAYEQSYRGLIDRSSQLAEAYWRATFVRESDDGATDPKASRLHEIQVAQRSGADSVFAQIAASQRSPIREEMKRVRITERWVGRVLEVADGVISAALTPLGKLEPVVVGDLPLERVDEEDRSLVEKDASFYVNVGHIPITATSQFAVQFVRFSRVGNWRTRDLETLRERGRVLFESIEVDDAE